MIRILIADDHSIVRSGFKQILASETDLIVSAEASQGSEVLARLREGGIDLVIMDMTMPGISGLDLISRIHAEAAEVAIVVLSMHNESQLVSRALRAGAAGYVTKDSDSSVLISAIRKVASGRRFIDPNLVDALIFSSRDEAPPHESLSNREYEILQLLCEGSSLAEVAEKLHISNKTVSTHKARLMQKLNIETNTELVRYGIRHKLIVQ